MKKTLLTALAILMPGVLFANTHVVEKISIPDSYGPYSVVHHDSNLNEIMTRKKPFLRTIDYPTQVVRVHGLIHDSQKSCDEVNAEIKEFFTNKITSEYFYYNTMTFCGYDPKTNLAAQFSIDSYFDPMSDEAITYLQQYISEYDGKDLFGTPFTIENATGLAISLNIDAGELEGVYDDILVRYRHDNATLYYPNHYQFAKEMLADVYARFFSNDPQKILPFLQKWFFSNADGVYTRILKQSNYVLLQPERIFIMDKEAKAYTSPLRMYYAHQCYKHKNHLCL